jgi:beta-glucanase (GH16 family)
MNLFAGSVVLSSCLFVMGLHAETIRQDFNSMEELNTFWDISSWASSNRSHSPDNVSIDNGVLVLKLSGSQPGEKPVCAEISSKRSDFRYGSYRASIKTTNVAGGVVGWFVYLGSPLNEIDVEFLTEDITQVHTTLHHVQTSVDYEVTKIDYDPSADFHEYRFDWYADRVEYFIDGTPLVTLTNQVPNMDCQIMLNHWSGNIEGWGGPAPAQDIYMYVDYMYYSSDYEGQTAVRPAWANAGVLRPATISQKGDRVSVQFDGASPAPFNVSLYSLQGKNVRDISVNQRERFNGGLQMDTRGLGQGRYLMVYDTPAGLKRQVFSLMH